MPVDSGTQQQHQYAYDTVLRAHSRQIDVSDACIGVVTKLVASHDMCKTKSGCRSRMGISSENGRPFSDGGRSENDI